MTRLLEIRNLRVSFHGRQGMIQALCGIDLALDRGGSLALVGESGSGKTTLLRASLGLIRADGGSVRLFGRELAGLGREERTGILRRCGLMPQDPYGAVPPTLSVREAVMEPLLLVNGFRSRETSAVKAESLLREWGLPDPSLWEARVSRSLSGGQRQRVCGARAMALEPELFLADEPTSMQDASLRGEVVSVLERRVASGMGLVLVTHDLILAKRAARKGLVLYKGKVVEQGPTGELLDTPLHPYTTALSRALPRLGKAILPPPASPRFLEHRGCPYAERCEKADSACAEEPLLKEVLPGRFVACHKA
ncbi:MAG: ABC transporter ATP-binding protein [Synergistales bacterium]